MRTYADPTRCPDCGGLLPQDPQVCEVCALPLTGATASELYSTLQQADRLLGQLRLHRVRTPVTAGATAARGESPLAGVAPYPAPRAPQDLDAPRLRAATVPQILLGLGALCLLVAAVTFLAVAWSWLGVGGRTLVLVALTGTAFGLTMVLLRRGLRIAAEALSVVGLGLLALDVVGVRHAGWLGAVTDAHVVLLAGSTVALGGLALVLASAPRPLVAPALVVPVAVLAAGFGAQWGIDTPGPLLATVVVLLAVGRVGALVPSAPLRWASLGTAALAWLPSVVSGLALATEHQTVAGLWGSAEIWPLIVATAVAAAAGPVVRLGRSATSIGGAVAGLLGSYVVVFAALDNSPSAATLALLTVAAAWVAVVVAAPERFRAWAALPLVGTLVLPVVAVASLVADSGRAVLEVGEPFSASFWIHVAPSTPWVGAWLLVPGVVVITAAACALVGLVRPLSGTTWLAAAGGALLAGGIATVALYDVPLAVVVGLLALAGAAAIGFGERLSGTSADLARIAGGVLVLLAGAGALPSDRLTTLALAAATAAAVLLMRRPDVTGRVASGAFAPAFAGLVWAAGNVAGVPAYDRAIPVLLVLGGLAIWRPVPVLEVASALVAAVASATAISDAADHRLALAVHLTVAGVLVTGSSLVNPQRRELAWPGGLLLAAATWVRLAQLGVHAPEAYTLPSALVLCVVGAWRLRRDDRSATLTTLAPGLALATVPSLLQTLDEPVSLRALLLGVACLALALAGVRLRLGAPLVVGAVVGTLLVLRELAPYAATVPPWLLIGLSGALLTLVGVTWESRMRDLRTASHYVGHLR
ncbi:SCO7613 C-terminal domain-containing membrane protein [Nocardioides cynanchi]|uniref:SCO7613 C-terminal domain-containing membrane protein n=1 Tax=Nocardioides cynanchi TaxID=2558918 RepID=UPI0012486C6F|nr:hypothetical protein [Nocardioides cynanchi]